MSSNNEKICTQKTEWIYSGDTVEATSYHRGSFEDKTLTIYNKNQQIIQYRSTSNDRILNVANAYDANGNKTECITKISGELKIKDSYRRAYVYDKNNNWIKRTTYNLDGKSEIFYREKNRILLINSAHSVNTLLLFRILLLCES